MSLQVSQFVCLNWAKLKVPNGSLNLGVHEGSVHRPDDRILPGGVWSDPSWWGLMWKHWERKQVSGGALEILSNNIVWIWYPHVAIQWEESDL